MSIVPTKKTSKSRTRRRTSNWIKLSARKLWNRVSLNAQKNGLSHFADENGMYKGRQVVAPKKSKKSISRI